MATTGTKPCYVGHARAVGWTLSVVAVVLAGATVALHLVSGSTVITSWWYGNASLAVALTVPGAVIVARRPDSPIGWLMCSGGICGGLCGAGREYLVYGAMGHAAPGWLWIGWFCDSLFLVSMASLPIVLMLFPDGKPLGPWWGRCAWAILPGAAIGVVGYLLLGDLTHIHGRAVHNPVHGVPHGLSDTLAIAGQATVMVGLIGGLVAVIIRFRRAAGVERAQMKWLAWSGSIAAVELLSELTPWNPIAPVTGTLATTLLAGSVALAVVRHRLLDIDVVITRTLVFGCLTVGVVVVYLAIVLGFGSLVGQPTHIGLPLIATAVVAVGFAPLRVRVQRRIERLVYGERSNPYGVVARLGRQLEQVGPRGDLAVMLETVGQALSLSYVGLVAEDGSVVAEIGCPQGEAFRQDLAYGGEAMGALVLSTRSPTTAFDRRDRDLLAALAPQFAAVVHAVTLSADLQRSRQRLVTAKEEERRRLRRDLHDGVGPQVAALGLKLDAARLMVTSRPEAAIAVIAEVKDDIRGTLDDIRRLVYNLRPPALDQLGLIGALRERASELDSSSAGGGVRFSVDAPEVLSAMPAAVEVAAFWIATEAMTNVVRHAGATCCQVSLDIASDLEIVVQDNGSGLRGGWRPGIGTSSMAERAAELGGTCIVRTCAAGGTMVQAKLPLEDLVVTA